MGLRNKVQLIGNVGSDPEIINLDSGKKIAKLSLATNEYFKNAQGEKQQETQWHNLVAWNKTAELIEKYVVKGKELGIEGKLTSRSYEDKEGGKRYITEVVVNELLLLSNNNASGYNEGQGKMNNPAPPVNNQQEEEDDLPF